MSTNHKKSIEKLHPETQSPNIIDTSCFSLEKKNSKNFFFILQLINKPTNKLDFILKSVERGQNSSKERILENNLWVEKVNFKQEKNGKMAILFNIVKNQENGEKRERLLYDRNMRKIFKFDIFNQNPTPPHYNENSTILNKKNSESIFTENRMKFREIYNDVIEFQVEKYLKISEPFFSKFLNSNLILKNNLYNGNRRKPPMIKADFRIFYARRNRKILLKSVSTKNQLKKYNNSLEEFVEDLDSTIKNFEKAVRFVPKSSFKVQNLKFFESNFYLRTENTCHFWADENDIYDYNFGNFFSFEQKIKELTGLKGVFHHSELLRAEKEGKGLYIISGIFSNKTQISKKSIGYITDIDICVLVMTENLEIELIRGKGSVKGEVKNCKISENGELLIVKSTGYSIFRVYKNEKRVELIGEIEEGSEFKNCFLRGEEVVADLWNGKELIRTVYTC